MVQLLEIVEYNSLTSVQKRIDEIKRILLCLETELDEQKDLLSQFNEKTTTAESNLAILENACKKTRDEFIKLYNERNLLEKWVFEFKHNNDNYLEIQNSVKEKVEAFLTEYNGRNLLEFALTASAEALRQDSQRDPSTEKLPQLKSYDYDPQQLFFPNPYDNSELKREKLFESASGIYNELVKGLTHVTLSTAFGTVDGYQLANPSS